MPAPLYRQNSRRAASTGTSRWCCPSGFVVGWSEILLVLVWRLGETSPRWATFWYQKCSVLKNCPYCKVALFSYYKSSMWSLEEIEKSKIKINLCVSHGNTLLVGAPPAQKQVRQFPIVNAVMKNCVENCGEHPSFLKMNLAYSKGPGAQLAGCNPTSMSTGLVKGW